MTGSELALVVGAVLCCIGFAGLIVVLLRVLDTMRALRDEVTVLRADVQPLLTELAASTRMAHDVVAEARDDLERFDRVLGSAEAISGALTTGSRITRAALSTPMIKTAAIATGTKRTWRRLRGRGRLTGIEGGRSA